MKIKQMYLEDFLKECGKLGFKIEYNDESGIYYISDINLIIKAWNKKMEVGPVFFTIKELNNFLKLYKDVRYYIELDDGSDENK